MEPTGSTLVDGMAPSPTGLAPRLAEMVTHLTDCNPRLAVAAVNAAVGDAPPTTRDERLALVADAMVAVRRMIDLRDPRPRSPLPSG